MKRAAIALLLCATTAGCSREDPFAQADVAQLRTKVNELEGRLRVLELSRQASAERPVTLTQTWLVRGQPPTTSQTTFASPEACEAARKLRLAEARQLVADRRKAAEAEAKEDGVRIVVDSEIPMLQAACSG
jgi:hypothetical protein